MEESGWTCTPNDISAVPAVFKTVPARLSGSLSEFLPDLHQLSENVVLSNAEALGGTINGSQEVSHLVAVLADPLHCTLNIGHSDLLYRSPNPRRGSTITVA